MKMSRWFRFYDEALNDPKVQMLPADDFKSWVNILCIASQHNGKLPDVTAIAFALRVTENAAETVLERLHNAGLIDKQNGGANGWFYAPHGWAKRQYKSDSSAERVKRYRANKCNVTETSPETETDTETETEVLGPNGPVDDEPSTSGLQPEHVVEVWNAMAERTGLPQVRRLTAARRKQLKARIRENTLDEWTEAIDAIERSDFCRGERTNWRADFDFLLQPKSFTKLIEGAYDGRA